MFSVCVLTFADDLAEAQRCLTSLSSSWQFSQSQHRPLPMADVRVGLNSASPRLIDFVQRWASATVTLLDVPVTLYRADGNLYKYPLMRRMFREGPPLAERAMWFDDDSYLHPLFDWQLVAAESEASDMLGQIWYWPLQGNQWQFIQSRPWCDPSLSPPLARKGVKPEIRFCQGAWWCLRRERIWELDWPIPELKHRGGDSLLGEALRHTRGTLRGFDRGVCINCDERGRKSKARRRGAHEQALGVYYEPGQQFDLQHQQFELTLTTLQPATPPPSLS